MLEALLTRRGGALRSCLQQCGSKQQFLRSCLRSTESTFSRPGRMFATSCRQLGMMKNRALRKALNAAQKPPSKRAPAAVPIISQKPSKPVPAALPSIPKKNQIYRSFPDTLALRQSPTLLYQASSHIGYLMGCYTLGGLCFAYSYINISTFYLHPPEEVWSAIPNFIGGLAVVMVGVGIFFLRRVSWSILGMKKIRYLQALKPARIVRTISAVPSLPKSKTPRLLLRIEAAPMIPRKQPASITVPLGDVTLLSPLYERDHKLAAVDAKDTRRRYETMRELNKTNIMTSPFRTFGFLLWKGFRGLKTLFSSEKFVFMSVKGSGVWKLNTNAAWALENGKAIDRLIKHIL